MAGFKIPVGPLWKMLIECLNALVENELDITCGVSDPKRSEAVTDDGSSAHL